MGNDALATLIIGTVVVYLFRERVAYAAPPVGDLVVVEQDDGTDPPASEAECEVEVRGRYDGDTCGELLRGSERFWCSSGAR